MKLTTFSLFSYKEGVPATNNENYIKSVVQGKPVSLTKFSFKNLSKDIITSQDPVVSTMQMPKSTSFIKEKLVGSRTAAEILLMTNAMAKTQVSHYFLFISSDKKASQGNISYYLVCVTWLCEKYQILCTLRCSIEIKSNC